MRKRHSFESQLTLLSLSASIPLLLLLLWVMYYANISIFLIILCGFLGSLLIAYTNTTIHQKSAYQFRSLSNLLEAMTQGDYSLRARSGNSAKSDYGALDELVDSINGLANRLSQQRIESIESQLLTQTVLKHIDVAIVALDENHQISFINPAANKIFQTDNRDNTTQLVQQLPQIQQFSSGYNQIVELSLDHLHGRFNIHVEAYRESGKQHKLLFITDLRSVLRSEERKAWQSLVRVISHEINNSLAPITSISQTLSRLISRQGCNQQTHDDLLEGLNIIAERSNGLSQFVNSYKQLARLPEPNKQEVSLIQLLHKIVSLFEGQSIIIQSQQDLTILLDPLLIEQALINILKNALESMQQAESNGSVQIEWSCEQSILKLNVKDEGTGINNPDNLFVPFYTTKPQGSGIGLVLCRQIIEAHRGQLTLTNRRNVQGCHAIITLPLK